MTEMQQQEIRVEWRNALIALTAAFGVIFAVFYETLVTLVMTWWDKPEYNHCLLILPIIAYLIHERREIFHKITPKPCFLGLVPILGGGILWLLGDLADANVVRQFGLMIIMQGCLLAILGKRVVLALIFPIFYMIFLIPFGDFLIPMLQNFTAEFVVITLNLFNIPVFVNGLFLSIPAGDFHVAEACAGLRFLVATVALGTLMANVAYKTSGRQITVVVLSFIVPIIANGFRASGIILIAHWSNMEYATGADHITFGWIFFAIVLMIFISIAMTFTNRGLHDGYTDFSKEYWSVNEPVAVKHLVSIFVITAVLTVMGPIYTSIIEQRYKDYENYTINLKGNIRGRDVAGVTNWKPHYEGASQVFHYQQGQEASESVDIFMAYYKYQDKDSEMIRYGNGVVQADIWERVKSREINTVINGLTIPVNEIIQQSSRNRRLVWYWYWVDGGFTNNDYKAKFFNAKAKLMGGRLDSAIIALSVPIDGDDIDQKRELLSNFAAGLPPLETMVSKSK